MSEKPSLADDLFVGVTACSLAMFAPLVFAPGVGPSVVLGTVAVAFVATFVIQYRVRVHLWRTGAVWCDSGESKCPAGQRLARTKLFAGPYPAGSAFCADCFRVHFVRDPRSSERLA